MHIIIRFIKSLHFENGALNWHKRYKTISENLYEYPQYKLLHCLCVELHLLIYFYLLLISEAVIGGKICI